MDGMTNTKEVILKLKEVRREKNLSFDKILILMEENGQYLSKSTLSRVFAEGSEDKSFRYEETLRPIANALLDIETIEQDDDIDTQAYKSILKLKKDLLTDYANQIRNLKAENETIKNKEKDKYTKRLEQETKHFNDSLDFMSHQIDLKDQRIDALLATTTELMATNNQLLKQLMECPLRKPECNES